MIALFFLIFIFAVFSFKSFLYLLLQPYLGVGWSYVVDQMFPLLVSVFVAIYLLRFQINLGLLKIFLKRHWMVLLVLVLGFFVHKGLLYHYFYADDPLIIFRRITNGQVSFPFENLTRSYPHSTVVASLLLFGTNVVYYNILALLFFLMSIAGVYFFAYTLLSKRVFAFVAAAFYATTPIYLDLFTWQGVAQTPFLFTVVLISLAFLIKYQQRARLTHFVLSVLFFLASMKLSFIRAGGMLFPVLFLILFSLYKNNRKSTTKVPQLLLCIVIWVLFAYFQFMPRGISVFWGLVQSSGLGQQTLSALNDRTLSFDNYLPTLSFFVARLFLPTHIASILLTNAAFKSRFTIPPDSRIVVFLGAVLIIFLLLLVLVTFIYRKKVAWLPTFGVIVIFSNLFYIPLFAGTYLKEFDWEFIQEGFGYGPGSRYIYFSSLGLSILFAYLIFWLIKKKLLLGVALFFAVVVTNSVLVIFGDNQNNAGMPAYKYLPEQIFKMVPRDGTPKILFAVNPEENFVDRIIGEVEWLHGFYREEELFYTHDFEEVKRLIRNNSYDVSRVYAFYTNYRTSAFVDVSAMIRRELVGRDVPTKEGVLQEAASLTSSILASNNQTYPNILRRGFFQSQDLNDRIGLNSNLIIKIKKEKIHYSVPYLDNVISDQDFPFPRDLWRKLNNQPIVGSEKYYIAQKTQVYSMGNVLIKEVPSDRRIRVAKESANRARLRIQSTVRVSSIEPGFQITPDSLLDGKYTNPYFQVVTKPAIMTFKFPYKVRLGRILLSQPTTDPSMLTELGIYTSDNDLYPIATLKDVTRLPWGSGGRTLYEIPLGSIFTDTLQVKAKATSVIFDEVIFDSPGALQFSPQVLYELGQLNHRYVDGRELFDVLLGDPEFNSLGVLYACAEEDDWKKQKRSLSQSIPGIWYTSEIALNKSLKQQLSIPISCFGSVLRKIILIGPPYPGKIDVQDISIY